MSQPEHDEPIRVVVVDDHPVFRRGLLGVLADADDIEVTATVGTGQEALTAITEDRPDVVLLDLNLPDMSGIEVANRLTTRDFHGSVLILTMYDDDVALWHDVAAHPGGRQQHLVGHPVGRIGGHCPSTTPTPGPLQCGGFGPVPAMPTGLDGEPITHIEVMAGILDRYRRYVTTPTCSEGWSRR
jgi:CheY-like chemotaxis protein